MIHDIFPTKVYRETLELSEDKKSAMLDVMQVLFEQDKYHMISLGELDRYPPTPIDYESSFKHYREVGDTAISTVTYQTQQLHEYPEFEVLNKQAVRCAEEFWKANGWRTDLTPVVTGSWAVKHEKGDYTSLHSHGRNDISGVFYFKVPENSGDLLLLNPLEYIKSLESYNPGYETGHQWCPGNVEENMLYIWPSWLKHKTQANYSDESRIIMSYNFVGVPFDMADK